MTLSFDHENKCNGFRVDEDLNPAKYQHVYDHARARCLKALKIPKAAPEDWVLCKDPDSNQYILLGRVPQQDLPSGPAAGGGGAAAAAMDAIGMATDEAGPAAVTPAKHR